MSLSAIMNSTTLYTAVIVGLLLIFLLCAVMLKMAWGRCIELGISQEKIKGVIKSSVIFSIVPSLSIVIGLFSLAAVLGVPWPWFRLSVVGSVSYELMAADMVPPVPAMSPSALWQPPTMLRRRARLCS